VTAVLGRARYVLGIGIATALLATGCSGGDQEQSASSPASPMERPTPETTPTASPSPSPTPTPTPTPTGPVLPLTGEPASDGIPDRPAVTVKIDNTAGAEPQVGLEDADIVFEQLVEGGATRLAAMYHSELPEEIVPVRSLRTSDVGIASPTGGPIAASGGAGQVEDTIDDAGIRMWTADSDDNGFSRDGARSAPYNVELDLPRIADNTDLPTPEPYLEWAGQDESANAQSAGSPSPDAQSATTASVQFSPGHTTEWGYEDEHWSRTNGRAETEFEADTLIVMTVQQEDAGYTDPAGNPVPESVLEGTGEATFLLGDEVVEGEWHKDDLGAPLEFTDEAGEPLRIPPGHTWIELMPDDGSLDVG